MEERRRFSSVRRLLILACLIATFALSNGVVPANAQPCCEDCQATYGGTCGNLPPGPYHDQCVRCWTGCNANCGGGCTENGCEPGFYCDTDSDVCVRIF